MVGAILRRVEGGREGQVEECSSGGGEEQSAGREGDRSGGPAERLRKDLKKRSSLVKYHSLPDSMKDNEFIVRYYRSGLTIQQTLLSIFTVHNETLNIWTHLLGFLLFLGLTIYTAVNLRQFSGLQSIRWETIRDDLADMVAPRPQNIITRWPFFVFLSGAMFCLLSSTSCHLMMSHSKRLASVMIRIDYAGIASLIAASFYPPVYYSFMCSPPFCSIYLISITVVGVATILVSLLPTFQSVEYRPVRAMLFFGMGISGAVPCLHKLIIHWDEPIAMKTFLLEVAMGSLYGLGALIYATRVPERWKPGRFDIAGQSHQLFHILVVAAALIHYRAGLLYLKWRDVQGCPST